MIGIINNIINKSSTNAELAKLFVTHLLKGYGRVEIIANKGYSQGKSTVKQNYTWGVGTLRQLFISRLVFSRFLDLCGFSRDC